MNKQFLETIIKATQAKDVSKPETIQNLWSGYGKIIRYQLIGASVPSVVVKHVRLLDGAGNPRGWNSNLSHQRKLKSYQVESYFYEHYSALCDDNCRIPYCLAMDSQGEEVLLVLEDLDPAGFPKRKDRLNWDEMVICLRWLANFHATFLNQQPEGLWKSGTYWHLETRPDELEVLNDKALKQAASAIDGRLNASPFQTFVHGDAKLANFCFSPDGKQVAAVDFQYVGGGCGMKDVAYFVGSCLYEEDCEQLESRILNTYFEALEEALIRHEKQIDFIALHNDWRGLYHTAWADFHRFLKGWSPGHWKINSYSERVCREVIAELKN
ncbi:phosphotransferase [Mangrovibacterium marinum]|uniref:Ecdysteroid kinase n=1 Tax=Mangrovibacterium marinum TaxID=1639118 RepID=A0A2T5BXC3_9BACT|nr:phosphotransferase [Mangrovibacterium marinum]PTN04810.1 ecdysteroid kinase [Mangrovibacterium marinum]